MSTRFVSLGHIHDLVVISKAKPKLKFLVASDALRRHSQEFVTEIERSSEKPSFIHPPTVILDEDTDVVHIILLVLHDQLDHVFEVYDEIGLAQLSMIAEACDKYGCSIGVAALVDMCTEGLKLEDLTDSELGQLLRVYFHFNVSDKFREVARYFAKHCTESMLVLVGHRDDPLRWPLSKLPYRAHNAGQLLISRREAGVPPCQGARYHGPNGPASLAPRVPWR